MEIAYRDQPRTPRITYHPKVGAKERSAVHGDPFVGDRTTPLEGEEPWSTPSDSSTTPTAKSAVLSKPVSGPVRLRDSERLAEETA